MEKIDRISGLDKLLELLTEHCRKHYGFKEKDDIEIDTDSCNFHLYYKGKRYFSIQPEKIIFKEFGFIKLLVDNDKIDRDKFNYCRDNFFDIKYYGFSTHQYILMLLSIQDNPIEFLISVLK